MRIEETEISESSFLLPSYRPDHHPDETRRRWGAPPCDFSAANRYSKKYAVLAFILVALFGTTTLSYLSITRRFSSTRVTPSSMGEQDFASLDQMKQQGSELWEKAKKGEQQFGSQLQSAAGAAKDKLQEFNTSSAIATGEEDAQHVWDSIVSHEQEYQHDVSTWWNQTAQGAEEESGTFEHNFQSWWDRTKHQLARLGTTLRGFWKTTANETEAETSTIEHNFKHWWGKANAEEKVFWNESVHAYHHWSHVAGDKMNVWWNATSNATENAYEGTVEGEQQWWNATQLWFQNHATNAQEMQTPLLYLNNTQAYNMLLNGISWFDYSQDFFAYQRGFDVQINQGYCAVATAAAVLNSLQDGSSPTEVPVIDPHYDPYPYATQKSLLANACVKSNVVEETRDFDGVLSPPGGLNLAQTGDLLKCFLKSVTVTHVSEDILLDEMREVISSALEDKTARVLVNYDRSVFGQDGAGHFSPIASYSKHEDAFLVLDVAKYKYPSVWVPAAKLHAAMQTLDSCGQWDYPTAQDKLVSRHHNSTDDTQDVRRELNCKPKHRGFIVVKMN